MPFLSLVTMPSFFPDVVQFSCYFILLELGNDVSALEVTLLPIPFQARTGNHMDQLNFCAYIKMSIR